MLNKQKLTELNKIKANIEKIQKKFAEIRGYSEEDVQKMCSADDMGMQMDSMQSDVDYLYRYLSNIQQYIYQVEGAFYSWASDHQTNHVPKLNASAMEKFLKVVGMDGDFQVQKPQIYMSATKHGPILELNYSKLNK